MADLAGKGGHSHALFMRAPDSHLVVLTLTARDDYSGGVGMVRTEEDFPFTLPSGAFAA